MEEIGNLEADESEAMTESPSSEPDFAEVEGEDAEGAEGQEAGGEEAEGVEGVVNDKMMQEIGKLQPDESEEMTETPEDIPQFDEVEGA